MDGKGVDNACLLHDRRRTSQIIPYLSRIICAVLVQNGSLAQAGGVLIEDRPMQRPSKGKSVNRSLRSLALGHTLFHCHPIILN